MTDSPTPETSPVKATGSTIWSTARLNAALAAFQAELPYIEADETADAGTYSYKYADLAQVSSKVLPLLGKHGLAFTAFPTVNAAGKFVLRYELLHVSGEHKEGEYPITGGNAQAIGSSITYARRYCLWNFQYGTFVQAEAEASYKAWSDGGALTSADAAELRRFAAYLSNLPKEDAGSDPATEQAPPQDAKLITPRQRGKLFALMGEIGLHDKADQLRWINKQLHTEYESRTEVTFDNANVLIKGLEQGIDAPSEPA
jgi:hypothetical protein